MSLLSMSKQLIARTSFYVIGAVLAYLIICFIKYIKKRKDNK